MPKYLSRFCQSSSTHGRDIGKIYLRKAKSPVRTGRGGWGPFGFGGEGDECGDGEESEDGEVTGR